MIITIIVIDLILMIMINDRHLQVGGRQLFSISESQLDVCGRLPGVDGRVEISSATGPGSGR